MLLGFVENGFDPVFANDCEQDSCESLLKNFARIMEVAQCRIEDLPPGLHLHPVDVIEAGPPFRGEQDRGFASLVSMVNHVRPRAFVFDTSVRESNTLYHLTMIDTLARNYWIMPTYVLDEDAPFIFQRIIWLGFRRDVAVSTVIDYADGRVDYLPHPKRSAHEEDIDYLKGIYGYPDAFELCGSNTHQLIARSTPPRLSRLIAAEIRRRLEPETTKKET